MDFGRITSLQEQMYTRAIISSSLDFQEGEEGVREMEEVIRLVAFSQELGPGDVKPLSHFEQELVLFRGHSGKAVVVDLVGAVHLGDKAYYERLNELFENYDAVLYEFVAPEGYEVPAQAFAMATALPAGLLNVPGSHGRLIAGERFEGIHLDRAFRVTVP